MLALQITALKPFMNSLLLGELFDSFLLEKADIDTAVTLYRKCGNFKPALDRLAELKR